MPGEQWSRRKREGEEERGVRSDIMCGVEIENAWPESRSREPHHPKGVNFLLDNLPPGCGMVEDGGGREIQTPPCSGSELVWYLEEICSLFNESAYVPADCAGTHIHMSVPKCAKTVAKLVNVTAAIEDLPYWLTTRHRKGKASCRPIKGSFGVTPHDVRGVEHTEKKEISRGIGPSRIRTVSPAPPHIVGKGQGLNIQHALEGVNNKDKHVEFRYYAGTQRPSEVIGWVRVCQQAMVTALEEWTDEFKRNLKKLREMPCGVKKERREKVIEAANLFDWPEEHRRWIYERQLFRHW